MAADLVGALLLGVEWLMVAAIVVLLVVAAWLEAAEQARAGERCRRPVSTPPLHVVRRRRPYDWDREGAA